ncbi:type IV secretion system DNA-binding domain-containing protein [Patescibacteria group bacterium]|nr:type IV secretion system DNA-binding domain-containing protein [Patescibacteria group bacterium]
MDWGSGITYIGNTSFKGKDVNFGIKDADRLQHISLFGKTGSGRTAFLTSMILQDIKRGVGTVVLDAVGNLSELLMERLDESARARLVYIDPSDAEYPFSWNAFDDVRALPEERAIPLLAQYYVSIYRLRPSPLTDVFAEYAFRISETTLLSLYDVVTDVAFRDRLFPSESAERVRFEEALRTSEEAVETVKRNGRYLAKDTLMRNILGQRVSKFTLRSLAQGAIVIVDLSRVRMFPTRFTPSVRLFAHGVRVNSVMTPTPPSLYIHDCIRAFSDRDIEWFYTERTIAGTVSDSVFVEEDKDFREKTLARAGSVIAFSPASYDESLIERVFFPYIGTEDFHKLDTGELAVALTIDAVRSRPFFAKVLPIPPRENVSYHDIQVFSRAKNATPRHIVDQLFIKRKEPLAKDSAGDPGAFSSAFRSIFAKGGQGATPPGSGAPPAVAPTAAKVGPKVAVAADTNKEPEEISEDELKQMLHVDKIFR